jgi:Na+(H+)/acetate symporter ActP
MQFLILLTGVLVFVFYHFHPIPLLWNPGEVARLRARLPEAQVQELEGRMQVAQADRQRAAIAVMRSPAEARAAADAEYRQAEARLQGVRGAVLEAARPEAGAKYSDTNYVFMTYVLGHLPVGLKGLIIAVIFAAAMSTLSGEFNSLASASMVDFYKRFVEPQAAPAREMLVSRLLTALWGGLACVVALRVGQLGSVIEAVNEIGSLFYGSILGVFALGVLTTWARPRGAFVGLLAGMASVAAVARLTGVHFLWYNVVGALTVFLVGWLESRLAR